MVFTVYKDNIDKNSKSNEATKHFHGTSIGAFQIMKSVDDGIARRSSQNDLVGTISDFSLPQSYTNVPPLLKNCKEYSCASPSVNIPEDIWCKLILKDHQNEEVIWMENFLSAETTAKHAWSSYHVGKKRVPTPTPSNSSSFPLLKDVVHTPDMQHHLIRLCIEYTNTLNPQQVTAVDCSGQSIYALSKIIQWKYPEFAFPKYFALFGALHIEKELLIANGHLVAGVGLDEILGDTYIDTAGLQTATVDVNHIHKARYSIQLSVVSIYTCLKKAHKASNSVLPLFPWVEERSSSSRMFKYWMLIMKFQINCLVFIRSTRRQF